MRRLILFLAFAVLSLCLAAAWTPAEAQFGGLKDKLKKKAKETAQQKPQEQKPQEPSGQTPAEQQPKAEPKAGEEKSTEKAEGGTATSEDMTLYTKYDFVPGDKVIFYDDLSGEEVGEFPSRWNLDNGVFEVARQGGKNYIMCTSNDGSIRPRIAPGPLPLKYTVELEYYVKGGGHKGHWVYIKWLDAKNHDLAEFETGDNKNAHLSVDGKTIAEKVLAAELTPGIHVMRIMATKSTVKCYIDSERVANVPALENFLPVGFRVYLDAWNDDLKDNPVLLGSFRYAEGGKTMKEQLDEAGRIVTHGILFDSGSARIKAESFKTLADIGQLLSDNPTLRVSIEGHTDSDGAEDANLKLSQDRANSVKTYLVETYKIDAGRLETKGFGESKPMAANDTPEGKATNRRVELVKL